MKRLLRVGFDYALSSIFPLLTWVVLSVILDSRLMNVFSLTYPFQFISSLLSNVFSTGANISGVKDKNKDAVMSGFVVGSFLGLLIFGTVVIFIEHYIRFMNMDPTFYRNFTRYSIIQMYLHMVFLFIINKLYYEGKNESANTYSVIFNLLNFGSLIFCAYIFGNCITTVVFTLMVLVLYVIIVLIRESNRFTLQLNLLQCIKYDSVDLATHVMSFFTYLIGIGTTFSYGEKYATAIAFGTLITDAQWDATTSIGTVAKIDISKSKFNYKEHLHNAYKLTTFLVISVLLMCFGLHRFYELDYSVLAVFLIVHLIAFFVIPLYSIKRYYLQLEYSVQKMVMCTISVRAIRLSTSFLKTPYCILIGEVISPMLNLIVTNVIFRRHYTLSEDGVPITKKLRKTEDAT